MTKIMKWVCSGMMFLSVTACGTNSGETGSSAVENTKSFAGKKVLVAYYSHSGNTQAVARQIARQTGGDLFAIETVQQYPSSYNVLVEQAKQEIRNGFMPELKNKVPHLVIGMFNKKCDLSWVDNNNYLCGKMAAEYLHKIKREN